MVHLAGAHPQAGGAHILEQKSDSASSSVPLPSNVGPRHRAKPRIRSRGWGPSRPCRDCVFRRRRKHSASAATQFRPRWVHDIPPGIEWGLRARPGVNGIICAHWSGTTSRSVITRSAPYLARTAARAGGHHHPSARLLTQRVETLQRFGMAPARHRSSAARQAGPGPGRQSGRPTVDDLVSRVLDELF